MWTVASRVTYRQHNSLPFAFFSHQTSALSWRADIPTFYVTKLDFSFLHVSSDFNKLLEIPIAVAAAAAAAPPPPTKHQ